MEGDSLLGLDALERYTGTMDFARQHPFDLTARPGEQNEPFPEDISRYLELSDSEELSSD